MGGILRQTSDHALKIPACAFGRICARLERQREPLAGLLSLSHWTLAAQKTLSASVYTEMCRFLRCKVRQSNEPPSDRERELSDPEDSFKLPPYPYIPGLSPRHPEHRFDRLKATVSDDIAPADLPETEAFKAGRAFYKAGYYWECHEVLDPVWMRTTDPSAERDIVLALIQLANARLKLRLRRPREAWRLCDMVETHLSRCPRDRPVLGLNVHELFEESQATRLLAKAAM